MAEFEEQFPESLDFMARSLKAGHAFSVSLELMADESPEPVGSEFRKLFHEQNLGSPLNEAMRNLAQRVPLIDVRFFVSAVLLQRETGGNLAEILENLAHVIRQNTVDGHLGYVPVKHILCIGREILARAWPSSNPARPRSPRSASVLG